MTTFKQFLIEEDINPDKNIFSFQAIKLKIFPRLASVIETLEDDIVPMQTELEFMDMIQLIKQLIIDNINNENFINKLTSEIEDSLKITYPNSNVIELYNSINKEIIDSIELAGVQNLKQTIDLNDLTMDSTDEFGKILYRIYSKELTKSDELENNDLNSIKIWINKIKRGGQSFNAKIRNRKHLKEKMFDKISSEEEITDFDEEMI